MRSIPIPQGMIISALAFNSWLLLLLLAQAMHAAASQLLALFGG